MRLPNILNIENSLGDDQSKATHHEPYDFTERVSREIAEVEPSFREEIS